MSSAAWLPAPAVSLLDGRDPVFIVSSSASCAPLFLMPLGELQSCDDAPPAADRLGGYHAGVGPGLENRAGHGSGAGDHHIIADPDVPGDADRPADHAARADAVATGHPGATGDGG